MFYACCAVSAVPWLLASIIVSARTRDAERPPLLQRWSVGARTARFAGMMINAWLFKAWLLRLSGLCRALL